MISKKLALVICISAIWLGWVVFLSSSNIFPTASQLEEQRAREKAIIMESESSSVLSTPPEKEDPELSKNAKELSASMVAEYMDLYDQGEHFKERCELSGFIASSFLSSENPDDKAAYLRWKEKEDYDCAQVKK